MTHQENNSLKRGHYRLTARTESAMFMHSPRGAEYSEIRSSALRGMMRYWLRAALARSASLEELRTFERFVFGDELTGTRLSIRTDVAQRYEEICTKRSPVPHKLVPLSGATDVVASDSDPTTALTSEASSPQPTEATTADAGSAQKSDPRKNRPQRPEPFPLVSSINPGVDLHVTLSATGAASDDALEAALAALWLAANLGGFGTRKRRGAGSLSIVAIEPSHAFSVPESEGVFPSAAELSTFLSMGLRYARSTLSRIFAIHGKSGGTPDLTIPYLAGAFQVSVAAVDGGDEEEIRRSLMLSLREFKNPAFGLPLKLNGQFVVPENTPKGRRVRFASPLWIRTVKTASGYAVVTTLLDPLPHAPGLDAGKITGFLEKLGAAVLPEVSA
ncbi:MAG: hypothetical protein IT290_02705 [Deltaproteobacteria bacterium]|nr:hypothetical protein [Deltaproteobacteria bacterium]